MPLSSPYSSREYTRGEPFTIIGTEVFTCGVLQHFGLLENVSEGSEKGTGNT